MEAHTVCPDFGTWDAVISAFLDDCEARGLSLRTLETYSERLACLRAFLEDVRPADVRPADVQAFISAERARTSPATANLSLSVVRALYEYLHRLGYVETNPAAGVSKVKAASPIVQSLTGEEVTRLLKACDKTFTGVRDKAAILLMIDTGLRASELCGLDVADLDTSRRTLIVHGKGGKLRTVPIGAAVHRQLGIYLRRRGNAPGRLFVSATGEPLDRVQLWQAVARRADTAGVPRGVHRLRHTCAVMSLRNGADLFTVSRLLGHTNIGTTTRYLRSITAEDVAAKHATFSVADNMASRRRL